MANYTAHIDIIFLMTGDTVAHVHTNQCLAGRLGHFSHAPMTFFAGQFTDGDMPVMGEVDVYGILIEPVPRDILLFLDIVD